MPVPKVNVRPMVAVRTLRNISVSFSANDRFKSGYKMQGNAMIFHCISLLFSCREGLIMDQIIKTKRITSATDCEF